MDAKRYLLVPETSAGRGSGHLRRCLRLARELRDLGAEAYLLIDQADRLNALRKAFPALEEPGLCCASLEQAAREPWTAVILDGYRTSLDRYVSLRSLAPVLALDEGGPARSRADYTLDLLGTLRSLGEPNLRDHRFLDLPARRRPAFADELPPSPHILVSFGGEDRARLTERAVRALRELPALSLDVIVPALSPQGRRERLELMLRSGKDRILAATDTLRERLADYDLVVTHYGLTAFEALHARVPVALLSPGRYHARIARERGLPDAGRSPAALRRLLAPGSRLGTRCAAALAGEEAARSLAAFIHAQDWPQGARCPLCGNAPANRALARFPDRSYRRCSECGLLFMQRPDHPPITYAKDYFFEDYKKQYGKTYLEDFPNLVATGARRARTIRELLPTDASQPELLEIGCAYGPFLAAAQEVGFSPFGLEPAGEAVAWVREHLAVPVQEGFFPQLDPRTVFSSAGFDAVALWYVIEHFSDLGAALGAAVSCLKSGGILALSTPSASGISAKRNLRRFLERSPADHWSLWELPRLRSLLARYGLRLERIVVTGHHPERFPGMARAKRGGAIWNIVETFSKMARLGDTFELYARKLDTGSRIDGQD